MLKRNGKENPFEFVAAIAFYFRNIFFWAVACKAIPNEGFSLILMMEVLNFKNLDDFLYLFDKHTKQTFAACKPYSLKFDTF